MTYDIEDPTDPELLEVLLEWAWELPEVGEAVKKIYWHELTLAELKQILRAWIKGEPFQEIALQVGMDIDTILSLHSSVISYALQIVIEQGVALLKKLLEADGHELSQAVVDFPDHLRFGVPTQAARILAAGGVRHRRAAVALGRSAELRRVANHREVFLVAGNLIKDEERWHPRMGKLVFDNTKLNIEQAINNLSDE